VRESLTILASCLILILTSALVGPYFVDWTQHRSWIESQLSQAVGAKVLVEGAIDLRLLPAPSLSVDKVRLGNVGSEISAKALRLELSATPLMRGQLRFTNIEIDSPQIEIVLRADGTFALPDLTAASSEKIAAEHVAIRNASLIIQDLPRQSVRRINDLSVDAEMETLLGPYRATGRWGRNDQALNFRMTTGVREDDHWRIKLILDASSDTPRLDLDGVLTLANSAAGGQVLSYAGNANLSGQWRKLPWRAAGPLRADRNAIMMDPIDLRLGTEETSLSASGNVRLNLGTRPDAQVKLQARQIDLDRLSIKDQSSAGSLREAVQILIDNASLTSALPVQIEMKTPALTIGGETLSENVLTIATSELEPPQVVFESNGPGRSKLAFQGRFETGLARRLFGKINFRADDLNRFSDWFSPAAPDWMSRMRNLPMRSLELAGDMELSPSGFAGRNLSIKVDRSSFEGTLALSDAFGNNPARFFADLKSSALDLDGLPDLTGPMAAASNMDVSVALEARAIRLARFGEGVVDAGQIGLKLTKSGPDIKLERLSIANLGGAAVIANGAIGNESTSLSVRLDASRLQELSELLKRIAPGRLSEALASRAIALSPARVDLKFDAQGGPLGLARISQLTLDASARGTSLKGSTKPDPVNPQSFISTLNIDTADTPMLLRQLGLETLPLSNMGRGRIAVSLAGGFESGMKTQIDAQLAGSNFIFDGAWAGLVHNSSTQTPHPQMSGKLMLRSGNLNPLLQALAYIAPDPTAAALPADLSANLLLSSEVWRLENIFGTLAGAPVSGELKQAPKSDGLQNRGLLTGRLNFDRLSFAQLASLALGVPQSLKPGALWSDQKLPLGLANPPETQIDLTIARLDLLSDLQAQKAKLNLGLNTGIVRLQDFSAQLGEGEIGGDLTLRRDGANAALAGKLNLQRLAIDRPMLQASLSTSLDFTATGGTALALINSLAGSGHLVLDQLRLPRADQGALDRLVALAEADKIPAAEADLRSALGLEVDKKAQDPGTRSFELTMAAGSIKLNPDKSSPIDLGFTFDLRTLAIEQRINLQAQTQPKGWSSLPPQAQIIWKGTWANPTRTIDVAALSNVLSARAIARESARLEALEADIRERAAFARRQKAFEFMRQRDREIAVYETEQARLALEAEKRRVEEEKRLAQETERRRIEDERKRLDEEKKRADEERKHAEEERKRQDEERRALEDARQILNLRAPTPIQSETLAPPLQLVPEAPALAR
jgi:uncharacterized protein involved in outer membrane biogenesis